MLRAVRCPVGYFRSWLAGLGPFPQHSDLEMVKVGNTGFHHVEVHLDKIILDAARFRRGKDSLPIQGVLPHRLYFLGFD